MPTSANLHCLVITQRSSLSLKDFDTWFQEILAYKSNLLLFSQVLYMYPLYIL